MNFLLCPFSDTKLTQTLDFYLGTQPDPLPNLLWSTNKEAHSDSTTSDGTKFTWFVFGGGIWRVNTDVHCSAKAAGVGSRNSEIANGANIHFPPRG